MSEFEVITSVDLRQPANPVAPAVAPAKPKHGKNEQPQTDFAAALLMLANLPLSDQERAEAVRRLLSVAGP